MSGWNEPLDPDQIAWLQEQFELARQKIEGVLDHEMGHAIDNSAMGD